MASKAAFTVDDEELALVEAQAAEVDADVYVHHFSTPFTYEGKTYENLVFDFGRLTGADSLAVAREMKSRGQILVSREIDDDYCDRMALRACDQKIGLDTLLAMPVRDYNRIFSRMRSFFIQSEL